MVNTAQARRLAHVPTPAWIVARMVAALAQWIDPQRPLRVLEPACADAPFLHAFRHRYGTHHLLEGVELCPAHRAEFPIHDADYLLWEPEGGEYDVILGNPPYGIVGDASHYPLFALKERKPLYKKRLRTWHGKYNLYGAFIERSVELLTQGGVLAFIVPASWLVLDDFRKLRTYLFERGSLRIEYVGRVFPRRNVSAVILYFQKGQKGVWLTDGRTETHYPEPLPEQMIRFEDETIRAWERSGTPLGEAFAIHFAARSPEFRRSGLTRPFPEAGDVPVLTGRNLHAGRIDYETCHSGWWMRHEDAPLLRPYYATPHLVVAHTKGSRLVCAYDERAYPWREEFHLIPHFQQDARRVEAYLNQPMVSQRLQAMYRDFVPHLTRTMLARVPL